MRILSEADARALDAALRGAALFGRDDRVAVLATGRDRAKFLHNMLTQEVKDLPVGAVRPACLCDAQGGIQAILTLVVQPDAIALWTDRPQAAELAEFLDRYVIADDVEIRLAEDLALVGVVGPQAPAICAVAGVDVTEGDTSVTAAIGGVPVVAWRQTTGGGPGSPQGDGVPEILLQLQRDELGAVVPVLAGHGAAIGCHAAADALRILAGRPLLGADVDPGSLPLEVGLKAAVNYRKGCYLGQEAIAMMTYRGQLRRHLCWVDLAGPARPESGWALRTLDGKRAGRMGSAVVLGDGRAVGLALVQRKAYAPGAELVASAESGEQAPVRVWTTTVPDVLAPDAQASEGRQEAP